MTLIEARGGTSAGDCSAGGGRTDAVGKAGESVGDAHGIDDDAGVARGAPEGTGAAGRDGPASAGRGGSGQTADDLVIAGLVPLSTVDWPGRLVATVFCQGCPWNCFYCHNRALIDPRAPGLVPWQEVRELLAHRRGLLDGVVFTGGEALLQAAVADAAAEARRLGFAVGLHTAGAYPRRLRELVEAGAVDWVGLDVKALPGHYREVVGRAGAGDRAWQSLRLLVEAASRGGPDFEVRTTVVPGDVTADDAVEVARRVHEAGARVFALQQARGEGTSGTFAVTAPGWDEDCARMAARIEAMGWEEFTYRPT